MSPQQPSFQHRRRLLLIGLAVWATVLTMESLLRKPGFAPAGALPPRLWLDGVMQERQAALPLKQARPQLVLPAGVVELASVRYGKHQLRLLGHRRSGVSGRMPVEAINTLLSNSPEGGRCLVVDRQGRVEGQISSDAEWLAWRRAHPPTATQTLAWMAGLRPRHPNTCLYQPMPHGHQSGWTQKKPPGGGSKFSVELPTSSRRN